MKKKIELELKKISKCYNKNTQELANDAISLKIYENDIIGIIGESGSGKSTLVKIILGLEKQDKGSIFFENNLINNKTRSCFRKNVNVIFQNITGYLNPKMKIADIIAEPLIARNEISKNGNEIKNKVNEMLKYVGLDVEYCSRKPYQLSGGQCQRVAIARALISHPKILICDEITSALDVVNQYNIINIIKDYAQKYKTTVLFITHNIHLTKRLCNRIVVMKEGKIMEEGDIDIIFNNPTQDYTKLLIGL